MLANVEVADLLKGSVLFSKLCDEDRMAFVGEMQRADFFAKQQIFQRGDPANFVYMVLEGRVRLSLINHDGRRLTVSHACGGDVFGEIAVLDGQARTADATALTNVRTMRLSRQALNKMIDRSPALSRATIGVLCERLRHTTEQVEGIALYPIELRLARFFLTALRQSLSNMESDWAMIELGMSQGELGLLVGATRQKVNKALSNLEDARAIKRVGREVNCCHDRLVEILDCGQWC